jgi:predicted outer membrane repeat protein
MSKTEFCNNKAIFQGGAVLGSGFSDMSIVGSNIFRNNIALDTGDDFYVVNTEKRFQIKDANFWSP